MQILVLRLFDFHSGKHAVQLGKKSIYAKRVVDERNIWILNSITRDVIKHGTGRRALVLNRKDISGKTGTTNDQRDAWFYGYNADIVAVAWTVIKVMVQRDCVKRLHILAIWYRSDYCMLLAFPLL